MNKYFQMISHENRATINIFGDIVDDIYSDGICALSFAYELEQLGEVDEIDVYINSYGGSVSQGFAIYNMLKSHKAKVKTICQGFACSIASIIFMAGDERIMQDASLLMIHNPWTCVVGNSNELRKTADDLEKMAQVSVDIYSQVTGLDESVIKEMMDKETWITGAEAIELGFATNKDDEPGEVVETVASVVRQSLCNKIMGVQTVQDVQQEEMVPEPEPEEVQESEKSSVMLDNFIKIFLK